MTDLSLPPRRQHFPSIPARPRLLRPEPETEALRISGSRDRGVALVAVVSVALSLASVVYYLRRGLVLGYQDSFSHLEISRRVVSGLSPGVAQLGGIWLPVPQLLQSIFSWDPTLYHNGLAGALVSMGSYVATAVFLYRLIRIFSGTRRWPAFAGTAVFALNANVLYQQSTSMDELPFYAFTIGCVYYLVKWAETKSAPNVLIASIFSMLAMLCRYEGWYLAVVYVVCVMLMAFRMGYSWRDARGMASIVAVFGLVIPAGGWVLYNYLIFGNPLNFENGPDSSSAQMAQRHMDLNIGNWPLTLKGYSYAIVCDLGLAIVAVALLGLLVFLVWEHFSARSLPVLGLLTIIAFFYYSLEAGKEPLSMPHQAGLLNYRFGLVTAIPAAVLIGYLIARFPGRAAIPVAIAGIIAVTAINGQAFRRHQVVLATEAIQDLQAQQAQIAAGDFLQGHTKGLILLDIVQNERVDYNVVDRTIYDGTKEGTRNQWATVLKNPRGFGARVIVMRLPAPGEPVDVVYAALNGSALLKPYHIVYQSSLYQIYALPGA